MKGQDSLMEYGLLIMVWGAINERTEDDSFMEYGLLIMEWGAINERTDWGWFMDGIWPTDYGMGCH